MKRYAVHVFMLSVGSLLIGRRLLAIVQRIRAARGVLQQQRVL